jgi:homopolymeric O-antigen transport system permease protein
LSAPGRYARVQPLDEPIGVISSDGARRTVRVIDTVCDKPRRSSADTDRIGGDLYRGLHAWRLWTMLGWNDIRLRYRRSVLGPFWLTLSMAIFIVTLGLIYSRIFHMELRIFLPYIAVGFVTWGFISGTISESCSAFLESESVIRQVKLPFSAFVMRVAWRNFIVMLHTIILVVPLWLVFGDVPWDTMALILPGAALVYVNLIWIALVTAILSTRFRDVPQIVQTALQITVFATPIMWPVSTLGDNRLAADLNPAFHLIELMRAPLIGSAPAALSWEVAIGMAICGPILAALLFQRSARRIVYWL